ncbi:MAG: restriction endonuclease [Solirubrobacterales bacterium]|nr:restriction endonuclease [Solirubrobacterales bacterium]
MGYTEKDVHERIREILYQVREPKPTPYHLALAEAAINSEGIGFMDHPVHDALKDAGVHNPVGEWFEATADEVKAAVDSVRDGLKLHSLKAKVNFKMRPEQKQAVEVTAAHFLGQADSGKPPRFLWNCKMRFGKTFTAYQLAKKLGWRRVLVLTYKPAVESAWRDDLETHLDFEGWEFRGKNDPDPDLGTDVPIVWFASFQDVLGTDEEGEPKIKNTALYLEEWDAVFVDEYHFGAWREAARSLYAKDKESGLEGDLTEKPAIETPDLDDNFVEDIEDSLGIRVNNYLYLSGTPFRALKQGEFLENEIYNWTYSDEQRAKLAWNEPGPNPYEALPSMYLLTYEMPEALREVALNNKFEFSLTEFFRVEKDDVGDDRFVHASEVQKWLDLLRGQDIDGLWASVSELQKPPLPYEDRNLLRALQHTVWYLPGVGACKAMSAMLAEPHNTYFHDYDVVVAAGPGAGVGERALGPVKEAIGGMPTDSKSITVSCGKLMTGVTVPPWAGILMLRELKSPETYFQAAFRVQSPWATSIVDSVEGGTKNLVLKEHCYVIDFAPNRALSQIADYATKLRSEVALEMDDEATVDEFLEFLPVLAFTGYTMQQLRASDILDYLTRGISASMLARRWNSPELINLDIKAMKNILDNKELLTSLEQIEMYRGVGDDLTAMIAANQELKQKKVSKEPLSTPERRTRDEAERQRATLKEKLRRFVTRLPAFMYLTDERERTVKDLITEVEPELFEATTGLTKKDFEQLVDAGVFDSSKMNDAVWKFRTFEEPSLRYGHAEDVATPEGGFDLRRDAKLAALVEGGYLSVGVTLKAEDPSVGVEVTVSDDFGLLHEGIRYESPDEAARMATGNDLQDGWDFWQFDDGKGAKSLSSLIPQQGTA